MAKKQARTNISKSRHKSKSTHKPESQPKSAHEAKLLIASILIVLIIVVASIPIQNHDVASQPSTYVTTIASSSMLSNTSAYSNSSTAKSMNITFRVLNDEAFGQYGYWAIGNYTSNIKATLNGTRSYNVVVTSKGTWFSPTGARNPENGMPYKVNMSGTFSRVYVADAPGMLNTTIPLNGFVGTFNYNGMINDLLRNETSQAGPTTLFNWPGKYLDTSSEYITIVSLNTTFFYQNGSVMLLYTNISAP